MLGLLFFHDIKPCLILTSRTDRLIFLIDEECRRILSVFYSLELGAQRISTLHEKRSIVSCISLYLPLFLFNYYKLLIEYFSINSSLLAATRRSASSLSLMMMSFTLPYYFQ
ncbi:hypothetical protein Peur_063786 [Populus x canadensis]